MRVLKTTTCKTLTGKSTLTYQIGSTPDSTLHIRITKNSGSGNFSQEWVAFDDIQAALEKRLKGQTITSYLLAPLFKGKSVNTPAFLLSALKHLKLVQPLKGKQREHEPMDPRPFLDQVSRLMSSDVKAKTPTKKSVTKTSPKKAAVKKKAANKKKSMSRR